MKVNLAAFWDYSASFEDNCCAICRNALKEPCIECQALSLSGANTLQFYPNLGPSNVLSFLDGEKKADFYSGKF